MNETLIKDVAKEIASEQMSSMWYVYLLMLLITVIGSFLGSFLLSYAKKKGEISANTAHFEVLKSQLEQNIKSTEQIKVAVNYNDWLTREWKSLRQKKLEELLQSVYQADHWQQLNRDATLFGSGKDPGLSPLATVQLLSGLYFPELKSSIDTFIMANNKLALCISENNDLFSQIPNPKSTSKK
jgi:hypothetical protein